MEKDFNYYKYLKIFSEYARNDDYEELERLLGKIPVDIFKDKDFCLDYIKYSNSVKFVYDKFWEDKDFCLEACKKNAIALDFVPNSLKTYEMCMEACKNDGQALCFVPHKFRTYDMYLEAVKSDGFSLRYIPEEVKDYKLCFEACKNYGVLELVPKELIDYDICVEAVKSNGHSLYFVPDEFKTYDLCLESCKKYKDAIKFIPNHFIDNRICFEICKNNEKAVYSFSQEILDSEFGKNLMIAILEKRLDTFEKDYPKYFITTSEKLKNMSYKLNDIVNEISVRELKDNSILEALIERFKRYECFNFYNINNLKKHPDELLEAMKNIDFDYEVLIQ